MKMVTNVFGILNVINRKKITKTENKIIIIPTMLGKLGLTLCISFMLIVVSHCEQARYDNYRVYKTYPSTKEKLEILKELESSSDSIIILDNIHSINKPISWVVAPHKLPDFLRLLNTNEIEYELLTRNFQEQLDISLKEVATLRSTQYDWRQYYQLEDTYNWLKRLPKVHPNDVTLIEAGKTYEGRTILGVKISKNGIEKPGVFVEAGIHAREWIAPATTTYLINELLTSTNANVRRIAESYDWYIIPHANPDGYVHTHKENRLWRKTRTPYGNSCFGADPNRNWGFYWNSVGSSDKPCADTYAGPRAFSEIETQTLSEYLKSLKGKIKLYISFHAFSQLLLYPYGHTAQLPENHKDLHQVFNVTVKTISKRYGTKYTGGNIYDAIYPASGASIDWAYATIDTKMSFCFELRPQQGSGQGFILPAKQIVPTGEETVDSIVAMVNEVEKLGYFK